MIDLTTDVLIVFFLGALTGALLPVFVEYAAKAIEDLWDL